MEENQQQPNQDSVIIQEKPESLLVRVLDHADKLWPILIAIVCLVFWLGGMLEDSTAKTNRIKEIIRPLDTSIQAIQDDIRQIETTLDRHKELGGHAVMEARMAHMEREMERIKQEIRSK